MEVFVICKFLFIYRIYFLQWSMVDFSIECNRILILILLFRLTMGIKTALPRTELYLYTAVLSLALLWAGSWIIEASSGTLYFYLSLFLSTLRSQNYVHINHEWPRIQRLNVHLLLLVVNQSTVVLLFLCVQTVLLIDIRAVQEQTSHVLPQPF